MPLATRLLRADANRRLRHAEVYQETIRRLEDAARTTGEGGGARASSSRNTCATSWSCAARRSSPAAAFVPFRSQEWPGFGSESGAMRAVDEALGIDPKSVPALVTRANVLTAAQAARCRGRAVDRTGTEAGWS